MAASADSAPSYWETIVHAPAGLDLNGDMIIDELPTGSVLVFAVTTLTSWFFQLPGFILTYLLHGTHAGRFGSQAGLALTLIQWGLGTTVMGAFPPSDGPPPPPPPFPSDKPGFGSAVPGAGSQPESALPVGGTSQGGMMGNVTMMDENGSTPGDFMQGPYTGHEWISFLLMTIGPSLSRFSSLPNRFAVLELTKNVSYPQRRDRLVLASHVVDWLFPREALRIVGPRIAHCPARAFNRRYPARCRVAKESRGRFRNERRVQLGIGGGGCRKPLATT
jgi:hypothetical protein